MKAKINHDIVNDVKKWVVAGARDQNIARAFNCSVATIQNIKRTDYNFKAYRNLVNTQMVKWKNSQAYKIKYNLNEVKDRVTVEKIDNTLDKIEGMTPLAKKVYNSLTLQGIQRLIKNVETKVDLLTKRFDLVFPKNAVKAKGYKTDERTNGSV